MLKDLSEDIIIPLSQRENKATYFSYPNELEIDFSQDAEDISALIRGIYPWQSAYFYDKNTQLIALPPVEIIDNEENINTVGTIAHSDYKNKTISVVCGNKKILKFKVSHFSIADKPFTSNYIKRELYADKILD